MPELDFDLSLTITGIIALSSILSPIITAIINNFHQTRIRKLDYKQEELKNQFLHKRQIFENYLLSAGQYINDNRIDPQNAYDKIYYLAYCYATDDMRKIMQQLNNDIINGHCADAIVNLHHISSLIDSYLTQQHTQLSRK